LGTVQACIFFHSSVRVTRRLIDRARDVIAVITSKFISVPLSSLSCVQVK